MEGAVTPDAGSMEPLALPGLLFAITLLLLALRLLTQRTR